MNTRLRFSARTRSSGLRRLTKLASGWPVLLGVLVSAGALAAISDAEETAAKPAASVSVDVARDRARVMHDLYAATLEVLHHRYFHGQRAMVPARAMEDVFEQIQQQSQVEARWIAVNLRAMSINHEAKTEFEKEAVRELADGKLEFERIEDGFLRRATAIPLGAGCVSCHSSAFTKPFKTPRVAGLVISVPLAAGSPAAESPAAESTAAEPPATAPTATEGSTPESAATGPVAAESAAAESPATESAVP